MSRTLRASRDRRSPVDVTPSHYVPAMRPRPLFRRIVRGAVQNVRFDDMVRLVEAFGFTLTRVRGSHHIFVHPSVPELLNLQDVNGQAKPYQIRQFLWLVQRYALTLEGRA